MAKNYSATLKSTVNSTSAAEAPLLLLEISHAQLSQPIRVVNDNQDLTSNGNVFIAMAFSATLPDDQDQQTPRAKLAVDNVGKEMVSWLEMSQGGQGATCRMMQVLRSNPNTIEWEITLDLNNVAIDMMQVTGDLGFDDLLGRPAVPYTYRQDTAPGLF